VMDQSDVRLFMFPPYQRWTIPSSVVNRVCFTPKPLYATP
jgi:hypothetical protein